MIEYLILSLGLLFFGSYKKDFTALVFSGISFILYGLSIYSFQIGFGMVAVGFGFYVAVRSAIDLIIYKRKEVQND
jgi:hypothetical protein